MQNSFFFFFFLPSAFMRERRQRVTSVGIPGAALWHSRYASFYAVRVPEIREAERLVASQCARMVQARACAPVCRAMSPRGALPSGIRAHPGVVHRFAFCR